MRKLLISILLASAAASPAIAGPRDQSDRDTARAERAEAKQARAEARSEARSEHRNAPSRSQRPQFTGQGHVGAANGGGQFVSLAARSADRRSGSARISAPHRADGERR